MSSERDQVTIETYGRIVEAYAARNRARPPAVVEFLNQVSMIAPGGTVLEIGSGPGDDADLLEQFGLVVHRSDATPEFVERLHDRGHEARLLDVRCDALGGTYDVILANAVLLHLRSDEFVAVLLRLRAALRDGGALALTLKEGDGEGYTSAKVGHPRWFTYWREAPLRRTLNDAGFAVGSVEHVPGRDDDWLYVIARPAP